MNQTTSHGRRGFRWSTVLIPLIAFLLAIVFLVWLAWVTEPVMV